MSSANFDKTLRTYFKDSDSEISYGNLQLSIFAFQDDALRITDSLQKVQTGNIRMNSAMKRKQLDLNVEKCSTIVFGKKSQVATIREAINKDKSLRIGDNIIKIKEKDDYLGFMRLDWLQVQKPLKTKDVASTFLLLWKYHLSYKTFGLM